MHIFMKANYMERFNNYYFTNPIDFSKYDEIEMPEFEIEKLFKGRSNDELLRDLSLKYIYKPSLEEFSLKILDVDGNQKGKILFKKTCISEPFEIQGVLCKNAYDVFMFDYLNEQPSHRMIMGYAFMEKSLSSSYEIPMDEDEFIVFTEDSSEFEYAVDRKRMKFLYMLIQEVLYNRPTVFVESSRREIPIGVKVKKTKKQNLRKRIVKTIRVLHLNPDEYTEYIGKSRVITCPSWGVIGHTRTLKSGKQIWIRPYRKGRERNNPEVYSAKQYELEKK